MTTPPHRLVRGQLLHILADPGPADGPLGDQPGAPLDSTAPA